MRKIARSLWLRTIAIGLLALPAIVDKLIVTSPAQPRARFALVRGRGLCRAGIVEDVIFRHAKHVSQTSLDELTKGIAKGLPLDPALNRKAALAIQDFLKNERGRYWANVTIEEGSEPTDRRVVFNISEGPVLRVRSTQFVGGESLAGAARLRTIIGAGPTLGGGVYCENGAFRSDVQKLNDDVEKLRNYYRDNGYSSVQVFRELVFSQDYSQVDVIFHISEGARDKVDSVAISPNPFFDEAELRALLRSRPGEGMDGAKTAEDKKPPESRSATVWPTDAPSIDDRLKALWRELDGHLDKVRAEAIRDFLQIDNGFEYRILFAGLEWKIEKETQPAIAKAAAEEDHPPVPLASPAEEAPAKAAAEEDYPPVPLASPAQDAPAKAAEVVAEVRIVGNRMIETAEIMRCIRVRAGMEYNRSTVFEDSFRLTESKKFKDVRPLVRPVNGGMQITFEIYEFPPLVEDVVFRNVKHISPTDLDEITRDIRPGLPVHPASNKAAAREMQQFLRNAKGRFWATVTVEEGFLPTDRRVVFDFDAGPRVRIGSVEFITAGDFSLTGTEQFEEQLKSMAYDPAYLEQCTEALRERFHEMGCFGVQVGHEIIPGERPDQVDVVFHIASGERASIEKVSVAENPLFTTDELESLLQQQPVDYYDEDKAVEDRKALEKYITGFGLTAKIDMVKAVDDRGHWIAIEYRIKKLEAGKLGEIYNVTCEPTREQMKQGPACIQKLLAAKATKLSAKQVPGLPWELPSLDWVLNEGVFEWAYSPVEIGSALHEAVLANWKKQAEQADDVDATPAAIVDPLQTLRETKDAASRAEALASLREPLQNGGTQEMQDLCVTILARAATTNPPLSRELLERFAHADRDCFDPLIRLAALRALGNYQDERATRALLEVHAGELPFSADQNSLIRCKVLDALAQTGSAAAREVLLTTARKRIEASRAAAEPVQPNAIPEFGVHFNIEELLSRWEKNREVRRRKPGPVREPELEVRLAALRGLARFNDREVLECLVDILEKESNVVVRQRAWVSLQKLTGEDLSLDAAEWRELLDAQSDDDSGE